MKIKYIFQKIQQFQKKFILKKVTNLRTANFADRKFQQKNLKKKKFPQFSRFPGLQISKSFFWSGQQFSKEYGPVPQNILQKITGRSAN